MREKEKRMEQKTMGKFLAALRKANGYTQKELAEKINVSDKAVSRWERDESAPDISLLPVLAEIFGVTTDELLRGERITGEKDTVRSREKTEKLYAHLREKALLKYRNKNLIVIGIALVGFLISFMMKFSVMVFPYGKYMSGMDRSSVFTFSTDIFESGIYMVQIASWVGPVCYLVAVILEIIFTNEMLFILNHSEETQKNANMQAKYQVIKSVEWIFTCIGFCLSANFGFFTKKWNGQQQSIMFLFSLKDGVVYGIIAAAICITASYFFNELLLRQGIYELEEAKLQEHKKYFWKKPIAAGIFVVAAGITFLAQRTLTKEGDVQAMAEGTVMEEFADFREFMKQEPEDGAPAQTAASGADAAESTGEQAVYPVPGTGELLRLRDANDKIVYSFYWNNTSVVKWECSDTEDLLPITVYTKEQMENAEKKIREINLFFAFVYIAELAVVVFGYKKIVARKLR